MTILTTVRDFGQLNRTSTTRLPDVCHTFGMHSQPQQVMMYVNNDIEGVIWRFWWARRNDVFLRNVTEAAAVGGRSHAGGAGRAFWSEREGNRRVGTESRSHSSPRDRQSARNALGLPPEDRSRLLDAARPRIRHRPASRRSHCVTHTTLAHATDRPSSCAEEVASLVLGRGNQFVTLTGPVASARRDWPLKSPSGLPMSSPMVCVRGSITGPGSGAGPAHGCSEHRR